MTRADFLSRDLLFKYMPLERALDLLINHQMWFANPTIWKDPFEKRFIENDYKLGTGISSFPWKDRVYCMCMTQTSTSEAYWNTYANKDIGISFRFDRQKLIDELDRISDTTSYRIFIGKVEYQKTSDIKQDISKNKFLNPSGKPINDLRKEDIKVRMLLLKRNAYKYENELRFFIVRDKVSNAKGMLLPFAIPNTDLIKYISLDPRLEEHTVALLRKEFENTYGFHPYSPTNRRVQRSLLYKEEKKTTLKL